MIKRVFAFIKAHKRVTLALVVLNEVRGVFVALGTAHYVLHWI